MQATTKQESSGSGSDYNIAAKRENEEAKEYERSLDRQHKLNKLVGFALAVLDISMLYDPLTTFIYNSNFLGVAAICVFFAVGPIFCSMMAAKYIRAYQYDEEGKRSHNLIIALGALGTAVVLACITWLFRDWYWTSESNDRGAILGALLLNIGSVVAAVIAFIYDYGSWYRIYVDGACHEFAKTNRDILGVFDYYDRFTKVPEIDATRRGADDAQYLLECRNVITSGIEVAGRARAELANRVAKNPEERNHIMRTPLTLGEGQEVTGRDAQEIFQKVYFGVGGPDADEIADAWPDPTNSPYLAMGFASKLHDYDERLRQIHALGEVTADLPDEDGSDVEIVIED